MNIDISIIVAAYNAEAYLAKGIEGILNQSFEAFELLLVDDGSTDSTGVICDEYARKDSRIHVYHERHQGVAHSRQVGIENAHGLYTIHIDADDQISHNMLEEMYNAAKGANADFLICDYMEVNNNGTIYHAQRPTSLTPEDLINDMTSRKLYGALWNKLIRTSCFQDNKVGFREDLNMSEDMFFVFDVLPYCSKIVYLPKAFYSYDRTRNTSSLTNMYLSEDKSFYLQEIQWNDAVLKTPLVSKKNKETVSNSLLNIAYITLNGSIFTKTEWENAFSQYRDVFKTSTKSYKKRLVLMALNRHYLMASAIRTFISKTRRKA